MNKTERMGGTYHPYVPDKLTGLNLNLEASCATALSDAQTALSQLDVSGSLTDTEPLARLLLRAEAVSSSRIEGLEMPASKLLEHEELERLGVEHRLDGTEAQILGNLHALTASISEIAAERDITVESICAIHRALLAGTYLQDIGGVIRSEQNWIGGNRINPVGAAYVPPEPQDVRGLLDDLVTFVNTSDLPAVAIAALAHAQFETIHPFADGNGRTGRALVHLILCRAGLSRSTVPPVSLILATDKERYLSNLAAFRTDEGQGAASAMNGWIEYFARALTYSCERAMGFEEQVAGIKKRWLEKVGFRAGSAGRLLVELLPGTPVISIKTAQGMIGRSYPATRSAVLVLEEAGILHQNSKNRKSGIYVATDIMDAFNLYERSLATLSGSTASEKPKRPVPQRRG